MTGAAQMKMNKTNTLEKRIGLYPVVIFDGIFILTRNARRRSYLEPSRNRKRSLRCARGPTSGIAYRGKGIAVKRRGAMLAKGFEMVRSAVAFVARQAILRIDGVPLLHAHVPVRFRKDGGCRAGNAARIALDQGFLLDQDVELHGVNEQIIGQN